MDAVRESGGDVKIFSSMHISGERKFYCRIFASRLPNFVFFFCAELEQLTGIAAILRFPMPELDEDDDSETEE